jgi:hypothetical protein
MHLNKCSTTCFFPHSRDPSRDWFMGIREGLQWNMRRVQGGAGQWNYILSYIPSFVNYEQLSVTFQMAMILQLLQLFWRLVQILKISGFKKCIAARLLLNFRFIRLDLTLINTMLHDFQPLVFGPGPLLMRALEAHCGASLYRIINLAWRMHKFVAYFWKRRLWRHPKS